MQDEDAPPRHSAWRLGDDLSRFSVGDLEALAVALGEEAARVEAERARKQAAIGGAAALFKS